LRSLYSRPATPLFARVRDCALPQACFACGDLSADALCPPCVRDLPALPVERCPRCQLAAAYSQECGRCLKKPPRWQRLTALFNYSFPVDAALVAAKYGHDFAVYRWAIGQCEDWPYAAHAMLVPVPLAPARLQARGYNQAQLIAAELSRRFGVRTDAGALVRIRETDVQQRLGWVERRRNVRGAFVATRPLTGEAVVLVDDVLTTGATLNALARAAFDAGAASVDAFVLARVQPLRARDRIAPFGRAVA